MPDPTDDYAEALSSWQDYAQQLPARPEQRPGAFGSDPADRADICRRRQAGESLRSIAALYGVSQEIIRRLCARWGVTAGKRDHSAVLNQAVALLEQGVSLINAARELNTTVATLQNYAAQSGVDLSGLRRQHYNRDLAGHRFGSWTVLPDEKRWTEGRDRAAFVLCRCDCGTVRGVRLHALRTGTSRGCGCRNRAGKRQRVPWLCRETGELLPNSTALARKYGVTPPVIIGRLNTNRPFIAADGSTWDAQRDAAVPHTPGRTPAA